MTDRPEYRYRSHTPPYSCDALPARRAMLPVVVAITLSLTTVAPAAAQASVPLRLENTLDIPRPDETVAIPWEDVARRLPGLSPEAVRVVHAGMGNEAASQTVDLDADGTPEELLFQASFWPGEVLEVRVEPLAPAPAESRAYAYHDDYRDDVAWESDRIAYRMYGQGLWQVSEFAPLVSSGIDVWPKRVRDLVIDRWYEKGHDAYHLDTGEGADFFNVGESLGAGGTAIWREGRLHRAENFESWRILANGPVRAVFELEYEPWDAAGVTVSETKRISIDAGSNLFRQEVTYRTSASDPIRYAVGTVRREGLVASWSPAGPWAWLATWQPVERIEGGHGDLGTGVLLPVAPPIARPDSGEAAGIEITDAENHVVALATATPGTPAVQYVGAGWTASGDFDSVEDWWRYLDHFARRLAEPVRVTFGEARAAR